MGESQDERELHVGEREGDQNGSSERKGRALYQRQVCYKKESEQAKRTALGEVGKA